MRVAWWILAGTGVVLASVNKNGDGTREGSMSESNAEDEDIGPNVGPAIVGPNAVGPYILGPAEPVQIDPEDLDEYFDRLNRQDVEVEGSSDGSGSASSAEPISVEDQDGQGEAEQEDEEAWDDDVGPMPPPPPAIIRLMPQFLPGEVLLNNLLDSQCDINRLLQLFQICLQRDELAVFETACVACLQQYDPDDERVLEVLEMTVLLDKPEYFEVLIKGQCKSKMGEKVLTYLPSFTEAFIVPALRQCSAIIPRHAVDVWREEYKLGDADVETTVDWTRVDGITVDLHTHMAWSYKNDVEYKERRIDGLWARYSATGEGTIGLLGQTGETDSKFFATKLGTGASVFGLSNFPFDDLDAVLGARTENELHRAVNNELYNNSNRFRTAVALATPTLAGDFSLYIDRLTDGGPMILVYRSGELIYPSSLQTYSEDKKDVALDAQVWGQPDPRLFLPISVDASVSLKPGDVIVLVPEGLQRLTPEIDLRGLMYSADKECLPEIVADFLKTMHVKTKQPVELAAAIVI